MTQVDTTQVLMEAFRFSDLPGELRNDIYRKYFGSWDAVIEYDRTTAVFKIGGLPNFDVMFASRSSHGECQHLIAESFSGRLVLRDLKVRRERGFGFRSSLDVVASLCPTWLLEQTRVLAIDQGTPGTLLMLPWSKLEVLREIQLTGSNWPAAHSYPCGLSLAAKQNREREVFEGKYDTWCVNGFNQWSLVPAPIKNGDVRVVTIKQGLIKGIRLEVQLEHKANCVEVFARSINSVIQPKILDESVRMTQQRTLETCQTM